KLGPLVGKRTWGGLVGIGGYPTLIDGGMGTAPRMAIWFPNGRWGVENRGVAPDVGVGVEPQAVPGGHGPRLEKGVEMVVGARERGGVVVGGKGKKTPRKAARRPAFPNYYKPGLKEPAEGK